jgi:hypothetical protein
MPEIAPPATFFACNSLQTYVVPLTGDYIISVAGAQGGAAKGTGGKGAQIQGLFYLKRHEILTIVVGMQGQQGWHHAFAPEDAACGGGGGGGTFIWKTTASGDRPIWPLLVAGGGGGGGDEQGGDGWTGFDPAEKYEADGINGQILRYSCRHFGGGGGAGWVKPGMSGPGPIYCHGGTRWLGGAGVAYGAMRGGDGGFGGGGGGGFLGYASGGGAGFVGGNGGGQAECQLDRVIRSGGGGSYNSGRNAANFTGRQTGHGHAIVSAVCSPIVVHAPPLSPAVTPLLFPKNAPQSNTS